MTERQLEILFSIVKEHVQTSEPVGSKILVEKYNLDMSSATIRNEMKRLEKEGYILQPHTSAGRIPTDKAYKLYINSLDKKTLTEREQDVVKRKLNSFEGSEKTLKMAIDMLSEMTYCAALVTLSSQDTYFHGLGHMLKNPEFKERARALNVADIIDNMDDFIDDLPSVTEDIIYIGEDNPYLKKARCSLLIAPYRTKDREGVIALLGPSRQRYEKNISLLDFITESLGEF